MDMPNRSKIAGCFFMILGFIGTAACVSHLKLAKHHYSRGMEQARAYRTDAAFSSFKSARLEAAAAVKGRTDAQSYLVKGMAELELGLWEDAEESFRNAFQQGFSQAEGWASDLALFGAARALENLELSGASRRIYDHLLDQSRLKPVLLLAAERVVEADLAEVLDTEKSQRISKLQSLQKRLDKLIGKDMACGYFHYLAAQVAVHREDYRRSFEEAVTAKELGLLSLETDRDNDLQIIFCYDRLEKSLTGEALENFQASYIRWIKKWKWPGPKTPGWKTDRKEERTHEADD
ncbi:MAG: hypothetical protein KKD56_04780 [Acidobacteria bacterium]|nr:hypothetical protein [Acidobacteriota bacterium]MCG2815300.1 hypothetical protein [Candidatus Aminicenantes bacterium]MBU1338363.1 hypothetical protein [Acidobacteriota bacterium]MBU1474981.1 hypothetical protein [Acidobacteriota bacterium]MBU4203287.1 hypothetical protein [Acidobacteriota bacterium]